MNISTDVRFIDAVDLMKYVESCWMTTYRKVFKERAPGENLPVLNQSSDCKGRKERRKVVEVLFFSYCKNPGDSEKSVYKHWLLKKLQVYTKVYANMTA